MLLHRIVSSEHNEAISAGMPIHSHMIVLSQNAVLSVHCTDMHETWIYCIYLGTICS